MMRCWPKLSPGVRSHPWITGVNLSIVLSVVLSSRSFALSVTSTIGSRPTRVFVVVPLIAQRLLCC